MCCWLGEWKKISEAESDFGDFRAVMVRTSDGRYFVRFEPLGGKDKPYVQWLQGDEYLEWLRLWGQEHAV